MPGEEKLPAAPAAAGTLHLLPSPTRWIRENRRSVKNARTTTRPRNGTCYTFSYLLSIGELTGLEKFKPSGW